MRKLILSIFVAQLFWACGSQKTNTSSSEPSVPLADETTYAATITSQELKDHLYTYASDEFEGRETGAPGQKMAVNYIREEYKKLGIKGGMPDGTYFQEVPLEVLEVPNVNLTINGTEFKITDNFISLSSAMDGSLTASEIVFAGYGIEDANYTDYSQLDVKDKVVLIKSGEPKTENGTYIISGDSTPSKWSNFRQEFASKRDLAKEKGAKCVFYYNPQLYEMAKGRFGSNRRKSMSLKGKSEDMYYFMVNADLAKAILPEIDQDETAKVIATKLSLDYKNVSEEFSSENVLAYIPGSEKPNELIIISAHLDHEGIKDGKVYNGADDDGSGTVAVLEIAEAFQTAVKNGQGPKRSILFLNVTGEEKGLLGSRYYTDFDPVYPLANTVADLNIDMIGRVDPEHDDTDGNYVYLIGSDKLSTELHNISEEVNKKYLNMTFDYTFNDDNDPNRFYYRSDHYNFAKNNIPVIFYFNGTHEDYHQPSDTPDKIRYDLLEKRTRLVFYTAWEIANRPNRIVVDKAE